MSEQPDKDSKTEDPTDKKINDSLEDGNTPVSKEISILASIVGILIISNTVLQPGVEQLVLILRFFIESAGDYSINNSADATLLLWHSGLQSAWLLGPSTVILVILGILAASVQARPRIIPKRINPKWSRVSLANGWSRVFGQKGLVEFLKAVFKFLVLIAVGFLIVESQKDDVIGFVQMPSERQLGTLHVLVNALFGGVAAAFILIAVADIAWTRFTWHRDLRMTPQEIKDERKQMEGDPIVQGRIRSMIKELSRNRMVNAVPKATVVIANPTHYAVALRYVRDETSAPIVLAKGTDLIALKIREIAERERIPIIEDKPLARSLYAAVDLDRAIPPQFYEAVAAIVLKLLAKSKPTGPKVKG